MKKLSLILLSLVVSACSLVGTQDRVLSFSRDWTKELPYDDRLGPERYHGMRPLVTESVIYQGNGKDAIVAISRTTGRELWNRKVRNGVASGGVLHDGNLYFGASDGQFYSVRADSGELNWTFPLRAESLAEPTLHEGYLYFLTANNVVYAIDASTGRQKWLYNRTDTTTFSIRGGAQPTIYKGSLLIGFSDGFLVSLNHRTGTLNWERSISRNLKFKDVNATAVLDGNAVYVSSFDDSLYKLNADDGQILWRIEKGGHAPVTIAGDKLFYSTSEGEVLALSKSDGRIIWTYKLNEGVGTQPVLFDQWLLVGESRGDLLVMNPADGKIVYEFASGRGVLTPPSVDDATKNIYFVSNSGNLYALRMSWNRRTSALPWEK